MRRLTINGKEYTVEFSIEASLYNECTEATMNMILAFGEAQGEAQSVTDVTAENAADTFKSAIRKTIESASNIPHTAVTLFYAGLLEHHGRRGDNTVRSMDDATDLVREYIRESNSNFYDIMNMMLVCMGEDHFFDLTGLAKFLNPEKDGEKENKKSKKESTGDN